MFDITKGESQTSTATQVVASVDAAVSKNQVGGLSNISALTEEVLAGESVSKVQDAYQARAHAEARDTIDKTIQLIEDSSYQANLSHTKIDKDGVAVVDASLTPAQKNAIAIVSMAKANSKSYDKALSTISEIHCTNENAVKTNISAYTPFAPFANSQAVLAGEAYQDIQLTGTLGLNAIAAARQAKLSPMSEMFAPTVAVPPSKTSVAITVRIPQISAGGKHAFNGKDGIDRKRRSIVEARYNSEILQNETTTIRTVYRDTGDANSTVDMLAPANEITPRDVLHDGVEVKVNPVRCGKEVDLLGLNSTTGINGKQEDDTSMIAGAPRIGAIYLRLKKDSVVENIRIDTVDIPGFAFLRADNQSNSKMGMTLNIDTKSLGVAQLGENGKVKYLLTNQAESTILAPWAAAGIAVNLRIAAMGQLNLESGKALFAHTLLSVYDAVDTNGEVISGKDSSIVDVLNGVEMSIGYWDPAMSMTNTNWMRDGKLVDYNEFCFPYSIPTLSPFTLKEPTDEDTIAQQVSDLSGVVTQQADNNVALAIQSYSLLVERASLSYTVFKDEPGTLGAGSVLLTRPYHKRVKIDCLKDINSTTTKEKRADFQALFLDVVRYEVAIADLTSGLQGGIDAITGNSGKKVKAHIGCDAILRQHLFESGEPRTVGNYEFQIESSELNEWRGKCIIMLGLAGSPGENPLSTGQRWFTPDQLREATISGQSTSKHTMIIPHYAIVFNTPVMIELDIVNLESLFTGPTSTLTEVYTATDKPLEVVDQTAPVEA